MSVCVCCGQAWHPSEGEDKERNEEGIIQPLPLSTAQVFCWNICVANDCFEIFDPSPWRFPVQLPLLLMFNVFYFPFVADFSLMSTNWFANCNWWPGSRSRSLAPWRPRSFFFSFLQCWSRMVWVGLSRGKKTVKKTNLNMNCNHICTRSSSNIWNVLFKSKISLLNL